MKRSPAADASPNEVPADPPRQEPWSWIPTVTAGFVGWVVLAAGFLGMQFLMQERPEFAGPPTRFARVELLQQSPVAVMRSARDDVSVVAGTEPVETDVSFSMRARRDYRGLKTVVDLEGTFLGRYTITNAHDQTAFVLFRCPHPTAAGQAGDTIHAGALALESSLPGIREDTSNAWIWGGELGPRQAVELILSYHVAGITGLRYQVTSHQGRPIQRHRVAVTVTDVRAVRFESGAGVTQTTTPRMVWERSNFLPPDFFAARILETRSVYSALHQLAQIGPLVSLLFLAAALSVAGMTRRLTPLQILTVTAGYGFYFPLVLYLSARFSFPIALSIAALAPGLLLLNYARWLLGFRLGAVGGLVFLVLYQIFPTLAVFAAWNRGLVLLCLGGVTLFVLMNLQNHALRRSAAAALTALLLATPASLPAQEVQVLFPGRLVDVPGFGPADRPTAVLSLGIAQYAISLHPRFLEVEASVHVEAHQKGGTAYPLFRQPVHLLEITPPASLRFATVSNVLHLQVVEAGEGTIRLRYRVPLAASGNRVSAQIPMLEVPSGNVELAASRADLEFQGGSVWQKQTDNGSTRYELGVAGGEPLIVGWTGRLAEIAGGIDGAADDTGPAGDPIYGIRIPHSQHLTIINSDGTCSHFAEFQVPSAQPGPLDLQLPPDTQIISVSIDGVERERPRVSGARARIELPWSNEGPQNRRVSLRLAYAPRPLKFMGQVELSLPQTDTTIGTLIWVIALPPGFQTRVLSSGLDVQHEPPDLAGFGDYGRVLRSHALVSLAKSLLPAIPVLARLKYHQRIPEMTDDWAGQVATQVGNRSAVR